MVDTRRAELDADAALDAALDVGLRRLVYGTLAGLAAGAILFRGPCTRGASVALGAGFGLGSAYADSRRELRAAFPPAPSVRAAVPPPPPPAGVRPDV